MHGFKARLRQRVFVYLPSDDEDGPDWVALAGAESESLVRQLQFVKWVTRPAILLTALTGLLIIVARAGTVWVWILPMQAAILAHVVMLSGCSGAIVNRTRDRVIRHGCRCCPWCSYPLEGDAGKPQGETDLVTCSECGRRVDRARAAAIWRSRFDSAEWPWSKLK